MDFNDNQAVMIVYTISNIVGLLFLWAGVKKQKLARLFFLLLFAWASWVNYTTCHQHPEIYLDYAAHAIGPYKSFINGWFKEHITGMVTAISIGQAMIAFGMSLKGVWVKLALLGAILFLLCIAPLGVNAAFPFSITVSLAAYYILRKDDLNYLWKYYSQLNLHV